ncbi:hypothetical protein ACQEU5_15295 [Marinactinospora thermotolerans]|uniref:hypothetical protein n=1 Tax=Marinactinospora thermotolerans TaxID=531310 RepID=UPI003D923E57
MSWIKRGVTVGLLTVPMAMGIAGAANASIGGGFGGGGSLFNESASFAGPYGAAEWDVTSFAGGDGWGFGGGWGGGWGGWGGGSFYEENASFAGPKGAGEVNVTASTNDGLFY